MSLIQEALKRQQMEQEGKVPATPDEANKASLEEAGVDVGEDSFILPGVKVDPAPEPKESAKPTLKRTPKQPAPASEGSAPEKPAAEKPVPEKSSTQAAAPEKASPTPDSEPDRKRITPTEDEDGKNPRVLPAIAAMIILLILLGGALIWAVTYGLKVAGIEMPWDKSEPEIAEQPVDEQSVDEQPDTDVTGDDETTPETAVADASTGEDESSEGESDAKPAKHTTGSIVRQTVKNANAAAGKTDVAIDDAADGTASSSDPAAPSVASVEGPPAVVSTTPEPKPTVDVKPTPPPVIRWPDITISGVVGRGPKGAVFIDGKVYGINESVNGVRILEIKQQGALVEYKGERRLAKVGQPLNRGGR